MDTAAASNRGAGAAPARPAAGRAGAAIPPPTFSCRQQDAITTALDLMGARNIRRLPVLDANGRMIGLVTLSDLSRTMLLSSGVIARAVQELSGMQA